jgi:CubicO group peptidase (beta-lactamase class C family)
VASCPLLSSRSCFLEPTCLTCTFLPQAQGIRSHTPQSRLLLTQGRHDHQAVLPAASVTDSSTRRQTGRDGHGYGAQCWQGPFEVGAGSGVGWTGGWANGGQRVCAVPSFDLVMVVTAGR